MSADLPTPVAPDLARDGLALWHARLAQHFEDRYMGVPLTKFPEDLRVYEHLLWLGRCDAVIEIGTQYGGSALWFRDRLETLSRYVGGSTPRVVSVDIDVSRAIAALDEVDSAWRDTITVIEGDILDPALPGLVEEALGGASRPLVVEDSAHVYETTLAALEGFARFVPVDGFFVVEDGCVDVEEMRLEGWPRGVLPAVEDWLASDRGDAFAVRRDLELYGLTCHPGGFLQRVR